MFKSSQASYKLRKESKSKQLNLTGTGYTNITSIYRCDKRSLQLLCSFSSFSFVAFQVMERSLTQLVVLDGTLMPEFGGVDQDAYHA